MRFLSFEDVLEIHNCLVDDFLGSPDPVSPPGIRDRGELLLSAVSRQEVGWGGVLKYPAKEMNAASLCYGVCNNHCFHNGNKRTALVTLLCHLDINDLRFNSDINQDELYTLMLKIASHDLVKKKRSTHDSDEEILILGEWIRKRTSGIARGERVITFRRLRQILKIYGYYFDNFKGNYVDIVRDHIEQKGFLFGKKENLVQRRYSHIAYPGEGEVVGRGLLRRIRSDLKLTEEYGYDSELFYNSETDIDVFINKYRKTLRRLAKV